MTRTFFRTASRVAVVALPLGALVHVGLALAGGGAGRVEGEPGWVALAAALALVPWATHTARLVLWTRFLGRPVGARGALRAVLAGVLGSALTPTGGGGGALRWASLARRGVPAGAVGTLVVVETVEDALFFVVALPVALVVSSGALGAFAGLAEGARLPAVGGAAVVGATLVALGALGYRLAVRGALGVGARRSAVRGTRRVRWAVHRARREARRTAGLVARRGRGRFAVSLTLTALGWTARYGVVVALGAALGLDPDAGLWWALQWGVHTLAGLTPTPGGAGGAEAAFVALYGPLVPAAALAPLVAVWRLVLFYGPVALAALAFVASDRRTAGARRSTKG